MEAHSNSFEVSGLIQLHPWLWTRKGFRAVEITNTQSFFHSRDIMQWAKIVRDLNENNPITDSDDYGFDLSQLSDSHELAPSSFDINVTIEVGRDPVRWLQKLAYMSCLIECGNPNATIPHPQVHTDETSLRGLVVACDARLNAKDDTATAKLEIVATPYASTALDTSRHIKIQSETIDSLRDSIKHVIGSVYGVTSAR